MRLLVLVAVVFTLSLTAQVRLVIGTVVDQEGRPVDGARFEQVSERTERSASDGGFRFNTAGASFVIRKEGFQSEFVRVPDNGLVRVVLKKEDVRPFPNCASPAPTIGVDIRFAKIQGFKNGGTTIDADYSVESYEFETPAGLKTIRHGSGALWSFGTPVNSYVWASMKYQEILFSHGRGTILEARGELKNGNRWRFLGKFGETVMYYDVEPESALVLDKFFDSACVMPRLGQ